MKRPLPARHNPTPSMPSRDFLHPYHLYTPNFPPLGASNLLATPHSMPAQRVPDKPRQWYDLSPTLLEGGGSPSSGMLVRMGMWFGWPRAWDPKDKTRLLLSHNHRRRRRTKPIVRDFLLLTRTRARP